MDAIRIAALYRFAALPDPAALRERLQAACEEAGIRGTLLVAAEGLNGTIAGDAAAIERALAAIRAISGLDDLELKFSSSSSMPFQRMKVKLKREIVTMGEPGIDPLGAAGTYVEPRDWNALMDRPGLLLIDVRNDYEHHIGSFEGAIDPGTRSFREFPAYARHRLAEARGRPVAMFCTGGIRCEKATALLKQEGFTEVYHLKGGILSYLEQVPAAESRWQGGCFVFDERVAVGHGLAVADAYALCHGCRRPLDEADRVHPSYEAGVACAHCAHEMSPEQNASARERQRQIRLATARGEAHLGPAAQGMRPSTKP